MFGTLQLASSLSNFRTCVLNLLKKQTETKNTRQYLYNKVSIYILGKTNEVFMVGVDVRNLDINQQQHLLKEMGEKKQGE